MRLELYVQHDAHVQQVVDEQIAVECDMGTREGGIVQEGINIPVQSVQSYGLGMSWASVEEEELLEMEAFGETENKAIKEVESNLVKKERMNEDIESVMGWLDITEQSNGGGDSITKPLKERDTQQLKVKEVLAPHKDMLLDMTACVDNIPQDNSLNKLELLQSDDQLCLSQTRIVLAFGVLLFILVLALLLSCVLWIKARRSIMPTHHQHYCIRRPYVFQTNAQHCIL